MTDGFRARDLSLARLGAAPHRLMFFVGASNVLLAMLWWGAWLSARLWPALHVPQPSVYAGWLHAYVMQYQMLPSFMFGFLLTVFPRWMNLPELPRRRYLPVGLGLFGGQIMTLAGALGLPGGILVGWGMAMAGWLAGLSALAPLIWNERGTTWHAYSCFAALTLGLCGLASFGAFLFGAPAFWVFMSMKLGTFGLLLPIYFTVAHRMFPFFAGNAVAGYVPWRPLWLLALFWLLCVSHLYLELIHGYRWLWLADVPAFALTAFVCRRWWPQPVGDARVPPLLAVLFIGLTWLPVAFALYASQSIGYLISGGYWLGRAPAHALFVGFFGSVLVAMVTRVTQGHSGRPLVLPPVARYAFVAIQLVAITRIGAELTPDPAWQAIAALGWLIALGPWVVWLGHTYLSPRVDQKTG